MTKKKTSYSPPPQVEEVVEAPPAIEVPPEPLEEGVPVSSLPIGTLFDFDGFTFKLQAMAGTEAVITQMEWSADGKSRIPRWQRHVSANTHVKPI